MDGREIGLIELCGLLASDESCIQYLLSAGVVSNNKSCPRCKKSMLIDISSKSYRCGRKICRVKRSLFSGTYFEELKAPIRVVMIFAYLFFRKMPATEISKACVISNKTVTAWSTNLRQLLSDAVDFSDIQIGGEGIVVEVDETKLGKRKYNRGHKVEGVWVVVGIEHTAEKRIFLVEVPDRSAETLQNVLQSHILPGSILHTDCWKGYIPACRNLGLGHCTVNHSRYFKDPSTGVCTNTAEGLNSGLKASIPPRNRNSNDINDHLGYYIWRRQNKKNLWAAFLAALIN